MNVIEQARAIRAANDKREQKINQVEQLLSKLANKPQLKTLLAFLADLREIFGLEKK